MSKYRFDLPAWVSRIQNGGNKLPASTINERQKRQRTMTYNGRNKPIPIGYGRFRAVRQDWAITAFNTGTHDLYAIVWGYGEYQEIEAIYINDLISTSYAGVTVTNYLGTPTQTADPTLVANITGYNDDLPNVVYSVISIPTGTIQGVARFAATIKGRKVYDPRSLTTAYSENTALCLADLITNELGYNCLGVAECANFNDELIDGLERCKIGIEFTTQQETMSYVELLAEYAECFIIWEGDDIRISPDTAGVADEVLTDDDYMNLKIGLSSIVQAPNVVQINYTKPLISSGAWPTDTVELTLPSVTDRRVSPVNLPGIFRESEALRKGESRLRRAQLGTPYTWETFDEGILYQIGNIKTINSASRKLVQDVRITATEIIGPGRHRVYASIYSDYGYPDSVPPPASTGQIFPGMILPLESGDVPVGYDLFSAADGRFIVGAGSTYVADDTGGTLNASVSGTSSEIPEHGGSAFLVRRSSSSSIPPNNIYPRFEATAQEGEHSHSYSIAVDVNPYARECKLVIKTGGGASTIPNNCSVFANGVINSAQVSELNGNIGRAFKAASDWATSGAQSHIFSTSLALAGGHDHGFGQGNSLIPSAPVFGTRQFEPAPDHTHSIDIIATPKIKRRKLLSYSGAEDFDVLPGFIVAYQSVIAPDPSWKLCDGTNDTPDLRDYFIEYASSSNVNGIAGDNTIFWSGTSSQAGAHTHEGASLGGDPYEQTIAIHSTQIAAHNHSVSGSAAYVPPYYALYFYMYTG